MKFRVSPNWRAHLFSVTLILTLSGCFNPFHSGSPSNSVTPAPPPTVSPTPSPAPSTSPIPSPTPSPSSSPAPTPSPSVSPSPSPLSQAPLILYTDIVAGPNSGGENDDGAYLSIFGVHFGSNLDDIQVTIGGESVARKILLGSSVARSDVQKIIVQVGDLGNPTPGKALPIQVTVNGLTSHSDQTFTVASGHLFYFDPVKGNDSTGVVNDITRPFRTVQFQNRDHGAWGQVKPGDFLVLRGGMYSSKGFGAYFLRIDGATSSITVMGYPGEQAFVNATSSEDPSGAIESSTSAVIADLAIEGGGRGGAVNFSSSSPSSRVVNNEIMATTGVGGNLGGITGGAKSSAWFGNSVHDIAGLAPGAHCLDVRGPGSYEIGYNALSNCLHGNGLEVTGGSVNFHHNIIQNVLQFGIDFSELGSSGLEIWDNLVDETGSAGIRFNSRSVSVAKIYNNTFYDSDAAGTGHGVIENDAKLHPGALEIENNIIVPAENAPYLGGSNSLTGGEGTYSNNLWFGGTGGAPAFDENAVSADPDFVNAGTDFHLEVTSPAIAHGDSSVSSLVNTDLDFNPHPPGGAYDIGCYQLQ